jgi:hypothetical protein
LYNEKLKNEIRQSHSGDIPDFSTVEKEARNLRSVNKKLKLQIDSFSKISSEYTTKNSRLRFEIKEIGFTIKALKKNLRNTQDLAVPNRKFYVNPVQGHPATEYIHSGQRT